MSKTKLLIVLCVIAVILLFLGNCKMSCKVGGEESSASVSVTENSQKN